MALDDDEPGIAGRMARAAGYPFETGRAPADLADRIGVLDHGRIVAEGTAAELKADVGTEVLELTMVDECSRDRAARLLAAIPTKIESSLPRRLDEPKAQRAATAQCPRPQASKAKQSTEARKQPWRA